MTGVDHVHLSDDEKALVILDQSKLPNDVIYLTLTKEQEMYDAIKTLAVRGAPAIGIFAGFAMYVLSLYIKESERDAFDKKFKELSAFLNSSRPTAVNLSWALKRMEKVADDNKSISVDELIPLLKAEATAICDEDIKMCTAISEAGLSLLKEGDTVLTHCNAGPMATSKYGTAIGPLILGAERGMKLNAFADETRPLLQGARLTSYELNNAGVDVTLICDNMASIVMKEGKIDYVFVGCDRVAANGDAANKIGTSGVAILAKHYGIPFYVLGPSSTVDLNTPDGDHIEIELRDPDEIKEKWYEKPMAPKDVKCYNPSFDVTDHELIAGIITEKGILRPPYTESLKTLFE